MHIQTSFLFDLDGTLVDSVYQHVLTWKQALNSEGIPLSVWRIHRKIGMSGGLFTNQLLRETHAYISPELGERLRKAHAAAYQQLRDQVCPLPGARELLDALTQAVATSGRMETAALNLDGGARRRSVENHSRDTRRREVREAGSRSLHRRRAPARRTDRTGGRGRRQHLGHARRQVLPRIRRGSAVGGYGTEELERADALRVYDDPADLLAHFDEVASWP